MRDVGEMHHISSSQQDPLTITESYGGLTTTKYSKNKVHWVSKSSFLVGSKFVDECTLTADNNLHKGGANNLSSGPNSSKGTRVLLS